MKLAILFFLFAALATAAAVADTGESDKGGSSKTPSTNGPKGKDGLVFLDGPCTDDSECAGGTAGRCGNKDEYLKVLPDGSRKGDKASFACAYAKVLTGVCGYAGKKQCACFVSSIRSLSFHVFWHLLIHSLVAAQRRRLHLHQRLLRLQTPPQMRRPERHRRRRGQGVVPLSEEMQGGARGLCEEPAGAG
ncbi:uncharacterized protein J3D65DRAFT_636926 [Phyllosticta citribraziliensis]|uniref:Uncharacterized protein n=1 Tax=Phyllosticta citribraziliensis TaxID=989973 RepID=A0ABR1LB39_9PEZI